MVLAELAPSDRAVLADRMTRVVLPPHSLLFQQGDPSDRLWVVESGRARVFQTSEQGQTFTQAVCIGGTSVGLAAVVARARRDTSAETIDTCTLQVMPADVLLELMYSLPGLGAGIARLLATTAMESFARAEALVVQSARVRLARMLVALASQASADDEHALQIDGITQEDLARMVGVSRTWVVLSLKQLEEHGLIRRHRRRIVIPDGESIMRFVQRDAFA